MPIKVLHVGLGSVGLAVVQEVTARPALLVAGAVDIDPAKAGRDLGEVVGRRRRFGLIVSNDLTRAIRTVKPDIAVVCTTSSLRRALPDLEVLLKLKVPVISTTEELACPVKAHDRLARRIDALAKRARVAVLGTGVNPGFVMDTLPILLTGVCTKVDLIEVERVQDAGARRASFQHKVGVGLTPEGFEQGLKARTIGHVGFAESMSMIAGALGWKLDRITDEIEPRLSDAPVPDGPIDIARGVTGLVQHGVGYVKGKAVIRLRMEAYVGAPASFDVVRITGKPPLTLRLEGGVPGDIATAAIAANSIPAVLAASPGLRTMADLPLPSWSSGKRVR